MHEEDIDEAEIDWAHITEPENDEEDEGVTDRRGTDWVKTGGLVVEVVTKVIP